MKKIMLLCLAVVILSACSNYTLVYDETCVAVVEDVKKNDVFGDKFKYIVEAYRYTPEIKRYKVKTNKEYIVGQKIMVPYE